MARTDCSQDNGAGAQAAKDKGYKRDFSWAYIYINESNGATLKFTPKGSKVKLEANWDTPYLWPSCPSQIASPAAQDEGFVYIGAPLYNKFDAGARAQASVLKWPEELPSDALIAPYANVEVTQRLLRIVGQDLDGNTVDTAGIVLPPQTIDLSRFFTPVVLPNGEIKVQVLQVLLTATSEASGIEATVDLFAPHYSDPFQKFEIMANPDATTKIRLTQRGRVLFGLG